MALSNRIKAALQAFRASSNLTTPEPWLSQLLLSSPSASGKIITPETAIRCSAVLTCIRILSEDIAALPLRLYVRTRNGSQLAVGHPLFELLHSIPNSEMTKFELVEHMIAESFLYGGFYNFLRWDGNGNLVAIEPLFAGGIIPRRDPKTLQIVFDYSAPNISNAKEKITFTQEQVWRGSMLSQYGVIGRSIAILAREAIGVALAAEEQGARLFSNGSQVSGFLSMPPGVELTKEQRQDLADRWQSSYGGSSNAMKTAVLAQGVQYQKISLTAQESQFIESRKFSLQEIARIFRIPAIMLGANDAESTFASATAFFDAYVRSSLLPWATRLEMTIQRDLLMPSERSRYFAKHSFDSLLRADTLQRYQAYQLGIQSGWLNRNEVREKEDLNPQPGLDTFLTPAQSGTAGQDGNVNPNVKALAMACATRVVRKEAKTAKFDPAFVVEVCGITQEQAAEYCSKRESGEISAEQAVEALIALVCGRPDPVTLPGQGGL